MDLATEEMEMSQAVRDAYDLLLQYRIVDIIQAPEWNGIGDDGEFVFRCMARISNPKPENIPSEIPLKVSIPPEFPLAPVKIYSESEEVAGFPHQDAETRKLCLREEHEAPRDITRLVHYVNWAIEWLQDAANGDLLKPGDPYELPDFSRKLLTEPIPLDLTLFFSECEMSYEKHKHYIGKSGNVECVLGKGIPVIITIQFRDNSDEIIWEPGFHSGILDMDKRVTGKWLLVPDIRFKRHRPPQTYKEMAVLCQHHSIDFYSLLKKAWKIDNRKVDPRFPETGLLLVGFPIPNIYGEKDTEIHWQSLHFPNLRAQIRRKIYNTKASKTNKIWDALKRNEGPFSPAKQLPWGKATNITSERLYARGSLADLLLSATVALFGCGALGSLIAELLARGGVRDLHLFDPDILQAGNLCRHTLSGVDLDLNKAESLSRRLSRANPLSTIVGYSARVPSSLSAEANAAISDATLFIDCTTSDSAFEWLDDYATNVGKRMVSLFFDFEAEFLTMCISGRDTPCSKVYEDLKSCVKGEEFSQKYYHQPTKEELIIEGIGCWHATFPALNTHIQMLAATAADIMNCHIGNGNERGFASIIRRNSSGMGRIGASPIVELIWTKEYP